MKKYKFTTLSSVSSKIYYYFEWIISFDLVAVNCIPKEEGC